MPGPQKAETVSAGSAGDGTVAGGPAARHSTVDRHDDDRSKGYIGRGAVAGGPAARLSTVDRYDDDRPPHRFYPDEPTCEKHAFLPRRSYRSLTR